MNGHVLEQLSAYLDGELGGEERAAVQGHLSACAACAQQLEELAALDDVARALPADAPPGYFEALPARVRARLEARQRVPRWPVWSWAAAAVLLLAVLTPAVLRRDVAPAAPPAPQQERLPATRPEEPSPGLLESKDDTLKRRQEAGRAAAVASEPAATAPPPAAARPQPAPELRKQVREEALEGYAAAPPATEPPAVTAPAPRADEVQDLDQSGREDAAASAAPPAAKRDAERSRQAAANEREGRSVAAGAVSAPPGRASAVDARYGSLLAAPAPEDAVAARALRDAWRAFARDHASHTGADEARVRALEAGAVAYRMGGDPRDLEGVRADGAAYLERPDAAQPDRVRALLRSFESR